VLAAPVAETQDGAVEIAAIDTDSGKTTSALSSSRFRIKCYSKDANGRDVVDNAKLDTCTSGNHGAHCNELGKFICSLPDLCLGCACV